MVHFYCCNTIKINMAVFDPQTLSLNKMSSTHVNQFCAKSYVKWAPNVPFFNQKVNCNAALNCNSFSLLMQWCRRRARKNVFNEFLIFQ